MAKGFDQHQQHLQQLSLLGKDLTRRYKASCELGTTSGTSLSIYEVPPISKEPQIDSVLHLCESCFSQLDKPKQIDPNHWRILSETVWSEVPAVQVMAVRLLRHLANKQAWAQEILEGLYLEDELEAWVDKQGLQ
ncbi:phnA protein [Opitutia bacterium ISCC 51]|nr:phnA protein [Opitutae bacterium ISCC 51]QXD29037.1 phnA protein [Opitutae bacterium ISCC 52]